MSKLKKVICLVLMVAFFTVMFAKDSHAVEFNDKPEYSKTELFIDYTFSVGSLF